LSPWIHLRGSCCVLMFVSFSVVPGPLVPPLFPYTTLFRSADPLRSLGAGDVGGFDLRARRRAAGAHDDAGAHVGDVAGLQPGIRSEEHTSELQSRFDLVCRLLLEKKKNKRDARRRS